MQKEYTLNFYQHRYSFSPALSEIVAAKSSYDDVWYRGQVMTHDDNDCYVILFLDFGNTEVIHLGLVSLSTQICSPSQTSC